MEDKTKEALAILLMYNDADAEIIDRFIKYIDESARYEPTYGVKPYATFPAETLISREDVYEDRLNAVIWQLLVLMFGDYGTSPRYGWIDDTRGAIAYLKELKSLGYPDWNTE